MATITIDDGTFEVGNSFVTVEEVTAYHEDRSNIDWASSSYSSAQRTGAVIRSFDFFKIQNWSEDVFLDGIPARVEEAQCIAALKELIKPGVLQADKSKNVKRERIEGVMETEYFTSAMSSDIYFTNIMNLIAPYIITPFTRTQRRIARG
jgi:hypothetical protein